MHPAPPRASWRRPVPWRISRSRRQTLLDGGAGRASLAADVMKRLSGGGDALIEIMMDDEPDMSLGPRLSQGLADALQSVAPAIGAFAATGGETAAMLLVALRR